MQRLGFESSAIMPTMDGFVSLNDCRCKIFGNFVDTDARNLASRLDLRPKMLVKGSIVPPSFVF
jgi:hypothetical protein